MDADLVAMLHDPVLLERCNGRDGYNKPVYAPGAEVLCYVENARHMQVKKGDLTVYTQAWLTFDGNPGISNDDRITLPDGTVVDVIEVETLKDEAGVEYLTTVITA